VKNSLIVDFVEHKAGNDISQRLGVTPPFVTAEYDFVLAPARKSVRSNPS